MVATPSIDEMQSKQYAQDQALQNFYNQNATNATNQYNTANTNANAAQQQLQDFTKNMQSGTDIYGKALQAANTNAGYDVNNLNQAQNQVSQLTGILGGLPRAIQASNANYGATAGNVANQVSTTGANINQSLQLANQNAQNQLQKQQGGLTGAQQGATAQIQTQDQQRQSYAAAANNAANIMQTAQTQMDSMVKAQQQGQQLTASDQAVFGQLRQAYAAASASYAQAQQALAQTQSIALQNQMTRQAMDSQAYQNQLKYGSPTGPPATAPTANSQGGGANIGNWANGVLNPIAQASQAAGRGFTSFAGDVAHNLHLFGA